MTLHVYENGNDFVVAENEADALAVWAEHTGEDASDYDEGDWGQEPDDKVLSCLIDDKDETESKTCAEWAAGGRRYLFSSDW